ncbi:MAG: hypothetical protein H6719_22095 [Sandaracinaceae bacterium]|nr:hypothetical protein [Sandaracinaceae bacterium]
MANVARAECGRSDDPRWMSHHSLVLLLNPTGAEYNGRFGLCVPLYDEDDAALRLNHLEVGVSTYLSPIYAVGGGYAQIGPASFLFLRAELHALTIWPIPLEGAGFYERTGYDDGWRSEDLPLDEGGAASGWSARFKAVLRGAVDLGEAFELVLVTSPWLEINVLDRGTYYLDVRDDLIAANGDWVFANEGVLLFGVRLPEGPSLRFGAFSALRVVPAAGYVGHRAGPFVMASFPWPDPAIESIDVFLRLGLYSHHRFRELSLATMAGVGVDLDMGPL